MLITSFSAGQLSKKLYGRIDLPVYAQGASELTNFDIIPTGGIVRRSGTKRLGTLKKPARLIPFIINTETSFLFEIGASYIRIWKDGALITLGGVPIEFEHSIDMPLYSSLAEAREVQYSQMYDELWLVHRSYPVYCIKWAGGVDFTLSRVAFVSNEGDLPFDGTSNYPGTIAFFQGRLFLGSSLNQPQRIWASQPFDYSNFIYFDTITTKTTKLKSPNIHVFSATLTLESDILSAVTQDLSLIENISEYYVSGAGIPIGTKVVSAGVDSITISKQVAVEGIDLTCTIQLWKTPGMPEASDYEDIEILNDLTGAAHAFFFEIASDKNDAIKWMAPQKDLVIGTESSEWVVPGSVNAIFIQAVLNSRTGSAPLQATMVGSSTLFFASGGRSIKEYYYQYEQEAYKTSNLALWCEEVLKDFPAVDFDYTSAPYSRVLVTRLDGTVYSLLYEKELGIMGWNKIECSSGRIISTATTPSESGADFLYFAVESNGVHYLETISDSNVVYLDGFTEWDPITSIAMYPDSGTVQAVLVDGSTGETANPANPPVGFGAGHSVFIGYPYESLMTSMPIVKDIENSLKRIVNLKIRFQDSYMPEIINPQGIIENPLNTEPFTGVYSLPFSGSFDRDIFFSIRTSRPLPCSVLSVYADVN